MPRITRTFEQNKRSEFFDSHGHTNYNRRSEKRSDTFKRFQSRPLLENYRAWLNTIYGKLNQVFEKLVKTFKDGWFSRNRSDSQRYNLKKLDEFSQIANKGSSVLMRRLTKVRIKIKGSHVRLYLEVDIGQPTCFNGYNEAHFIYYSRQNKKTTS